MKKLLPLSLLLLTLTLATSCKKAPLRGYTKINDAYGYKIVSNQDTGTLQGTGKYMIAFASMRTEKDSLLNDPYFGDSVGFNFQVIMQPAKHPSDLMHTFLQLSDGDSAVIKMVADTFFGPKNLNKPVPDNVKPGSFITFRIKVINLLDEEEYVRWQEEKETQDKAAAYGLFRSYLETVGVKNDPTGSGIVMVPEREGSGRNPKFGDRVLIHYMMVSFGGAELANTYKSGQPYDFTLGSSDVVYGLNEALLRMKKGGKARIYIPYYLAYGKDGVAGYVGPYTHLVMDVELLDIM